MRIANPFVKTSHKNLVVLVPLDERSIGLLKTAKPRIEKWVGPTTITAMPTIKANWYNSKREQLNGDAIINDLLLRFQKAQGDRKAVFIAVTSYIVYSPSDTVTPRDYVYVNWRRQGRVHGVAIGTLVLRLEHPAREQARLEKLILRGVGQSVWGLERSPANPKSVMYVPMNNTATIDRMVASLPKRQP